MFLEDIIDIKTGIIITRKKADFSDNIKKIYKMITLKNVNEAGYIDDNNEEYLESKEEISNDFFTKKNDILIRQSYPFTCIYIDERHEGLLVPSYFMIIRIKKNIISPQYLSCYLNTEQVKNELIKSQAGTLNPTTNKKTLYSIEIHTYDIPNLEEQQKVVKIIECINKERMLYKKIIEEKERLYKTIQNKIFKGVN